MSRYRPLHPLIPIPDFEPQTKGIVRQNAPQRLSLAVAPLMTQRSILFRVRTELGEEIEDYSQVTTYFDESVVYTDSCSLWSYPTAQTIHPCNSSALNLVHPMLQVPRPHHYLPVPMDSNQHLLSQARAFTAKNPVSSLLPSTR